MNKRVRVLSFGAGVQSSALLLMCDRGELPPVDFAVFADTMAEPAEVYEWMERLRGIVSTPIYVASKGNMETEVIEHWRGERKRCGQPPLYTKRADGEKSILRRHCTKEYKIEVVDKEIRRVLGYKPRQRMRHHIDLVMGISVDEMTRMRTSSQKWKSNQYPLVDMSINRQQCIEYVSKAGIGKPPRSACHFCPYKSDAEWRRMRDEYPADWDRAVAFDQAIRESASPNLTSKFYVHRSCVPLADADIAKDERQLTMLDECEGMCGV